MNIMVIVDPSGQGRTRAVAEPLRIGAAAFLGATAADSAKTTEPFPRNHA